ncbi:zinc-binding alcohol dehydrogenase [Salinisphaera sp. LB1]|uniref:zinc-dependent alcohol dehydrogenase n=1 Tax=Salinisphaera sp. LB1 TaxID=2183911 RepID=UPI000D7079A2|nr:zinc-binding alcohol dehydrogenase [Salinisphaera sp. LB1]AWN17299.1 Threonine dehydrogenase and related Zn-dependent dehydrogenase [Salinisphaera sp. LB1]
MTADIARALWLEPPRRASLRTETLPCAGADDVVVRTSYSAISRGTETLVYAGAVPESEYDRMRAPFQAGTLPGAVKHGYANVGVVERGPPGWLGRPVFCLYPHQTRYVVPRDAVVAVPPNVPAERAVLAANMETAVNALWDAGPRVGDRISVVGAGVIGSLVAGLCVDLPGVAVELVDIDSGRASVASALGAAFARPENATGGRDLVFHASASAAGLNTALSLAGPEAEIVELSWFGTQATSVALGGVFHSRRLTLKASQVGTVSPARAARWSHRRRLALALDLCADARFDVLFADDADFDSLPAIMERLADPADRTLCQRIVYANCQDPPCIT